MANSRSKTDPCDGAKRNYQNALDAEKKAKQKFEQAWRELGTLKDLVSAQDYLEVRRNLSVGDWPDILGPIDSPMQGYPSVTFVRKAKLVYKARRALEDARAAATDAGEALKDCKGTDDYLEWLRSKDKPEPTSACGAPCTSWSRRGQYCHHMLTEKRVCPNHGPRAIA
jgi:hypothetical protein